MKLLFLRGQVPTDRDPQQIVFDQLADCDDMWTQLARELSKDGYGEVWYWGNENQSRDHSFAGNFVERWIQGGFGNTKYDFKPDVIFARGGFPEYDQVLKRNPQAFKIYYGAGFRRIPVNDFKDYNLILVDTPAQLEIARSKFPKIRSELLIKPAAENIFKPYEHPQKKYFDVIMVGNYNKAVDKGHDFIFPRLPGGIRLRSVGGVPKHIKRQYKRNSYVGWTPRLQIPVCYSQAKVAIVATGRQDSCPRVIPEALACNVPILVLKRVNVWREKYITKQTGMLTSKTHFGDDVLRMVKHYKKFSPRQYYEENLSLEVSAKQILSHIEL